MIRLLSAFLLFCLSLAVPLAGTPLRVCRIDHRVLVAGSDNDCRPTAERPCCCEKQGRQQAPPQKQDCCTELSLLPQIQKPSAPEPLPPLIAIDLPPPVFVLPPVFEVTLLTWNQPESARGPDPTPPHRSLWGVWRL